MPETMTRCSFDGCESPEPAISCRASPGSEFAESLCPEHAQESGYCPGCGIFSAGTSPFDEDGLCETCQADEEGDEFDEDDEDLEEIDEDSDEDIDEEEFDDEDLDDDFEP